MIVKNSNYIQYGVNELVFDNIKDFKAYNSFTEVGTKAYIIDVNKTYILDSTNTWQDYYVDADEKKY